MVPIPIFRPVSNPQLFEVRSQIAYARRSFSSASPDAWQLAQLMAGF